MGAVDRDLLERLDQLAGAREVGDELLRGVARGLHEFFQLRAAQADCALQIEGKPSSLELPLDVQGTAFQRRVWQELQRIPRGTTRTYTQVAQALGQPKAVRAVARACATNPVSIVVPCHRVIRGDGNLAGYRWGLSRKEQLLSAERAGGKKSQGN